MNVQQAEIRRLRDGIGKLHSECEAMRRQLKKEKKGGKSSTGNTCGSNWYFRWKMLRFSKCFSTKDVEKTAVRLEVTKKEKKSLSLRI